MSNLMDRMRKSGSIKTADILKTSMFFADKDSIPTAVPALNIALSGSLDGGLEPGLTCLAGPSKHFKTGIGLILVRAYLDKYPDAICLFLDSEFGVTPDYITSNGIDTNRVLHIPIEHIEQMKFDLVKRLEEVKRGDHVIILIDSIGNLASKKEVDDALDEKSVGDMTRAKTLKGFFRIITPHLITKDIPCIAINHSYATLEIYSKQVMGGGTGAMYSANTVLMIGRQQEKGADGDVDGWNFILNVEKSRKVKEKSKIPVRVTYAGGVDRTSGLMDMALEAGFLIKPSNGWYQRVDKSTGEVLEPKVRAKDLTVEFFKPILNDPAFKQEVEKTYKVSHTTMISDESIDADLEEIDLESVKDEQ